MANKPGAQDQVELLRVGERIHALMWRHGVSTKALAQAIGRDQTTLSRKLRGRVPMTLSELFGIARALRVEPGELLESRRPDGVERRGLEQQTG